MTFLWPVISNVITSNAQVYGQCHWQWEGGGEILSFTRALRANAVAKAGFLSPLKLMEY